jgi:hypothetical protein
MSFHRENPTQSNAEPVHAFRRSHGPPPGWSREEVRPDVIARLEELDDVIFAAIEGDPAALQESSDAWQRAVADLGHDTVEETRRQYLRHAQGVWETLRREPIQPPHRIFAAIEIIGLLVNSER